MCIQTGDFLEPFQIVKNKLELKLIKKCKFMLIGSKYIYTNLCVKSYNINAC